MISLIIYFYFMHMSASSACVHMYLCVTGAHGAREGSGSLDLLLQRVVSQLWELGTEHRFSKAETNALN